MLSVLTAVAQDTAKTRASFINPYHLAVTFNKTTNLVFPYAIKSVDRGSRDLLAQKAIGVENVLQVKAAKMGFLQTNLTVVTADGCLYAYIVDYSDTPANLNYLFSIPSIVARPVAVFTEEATTDIIKKTAGLVNDKQATIERLAADDFSTALEVKGIYSHEDVIYLQLCLRNSSAVNYDARSLRIFIEDQKRIKRTSAQQVDMQPLFICGDPAHIAASSEHNVTVALPKFTIPDKKYLGIELMEKNGGRNLNIRIRNKHLISAKPI